jgi:hypothetical protein
MMRLAALEAGKAGSGLSCSEVKSLLTDLGFNVRSGAKGGHKVVTHPKGLTDFFSTGYNCKGGSGPVDRNYLGKLISVVKMHKDEIRKHNGEA